MYSISKIKGQITVEFKTILDPLALTYKKQES